MVGIVVRGDERAEWPVSTVNGLHGGNEVSLQLENSGVGFAQMPATPTAPGSGRSSI